jgi:hypothetical protein
VEVEQVAARLLSERQQGGSGGQQGQPGQDPLHLREAGVELDRGGLQAGLGGAAPVLGGAPGQQAAHQEEQRRAQDQP